MHWIFFLFSKRDDYFYCTSSFLSLILIIYCCTHHFLFYIILGTLLNGLFETSFNVMDAKLGRQQTTRGIWMPRAKRLPIIVMDIEGCDGAERGEDQDFERKAALFALTTSEVVIFNLFENQVNLYAGGNMNTLKTVIQVNLELFQNQKG